MRPRGAILSFHEPNVMESNGRARAFFILAIFQHIPDPFLRRNYMFRPFVLEFTANAVATRRHTSSQNILRRNRWPDILIPKSIIDLKNRAPKIVRKKTLLFMRVI